MVINWLETFDYYFKKDNMGYVILNYVRGILLCFELHRFVLSNPFFDWKLLASGRGYTKDRYSLEALTLNSHYQISRVTIWWLCFKGGHGQIHYDSSKLSYNIINNNNIWQAQWCSRHHTNRHRVNGHNHLYHNVDVIMALNYYNIIEFVLLQWYNIIICHIDYYFL